MSSVKLRVLATRASGALAVAALAACSTETTSPTAAGPSLRLPSAPALITVTTAGNGGSGNLELCKWSNSATAVNFTITKMSGPGTLLLPGAQQLTPEANPNLDGYTHEKCVPLMFNIPGGEPTVIRVVETVAPGTQLDAVAGTGNAVSYAESQPTATITIGLNNTQQARIFFKNSGIPDEPPGGCTYTQGYWKTHSAFGPAKKTDPTWASSLASGPSTTFLDNGDSFFSPSKTWYQLFWTPPKGNPDIILAHQFMAAYLSTNQAEPATMTATVQAAYDAALAYFEGGSATRAQKLAWANTLDRFANGLEGTPHCGDEITATR